MIRNYSKVAFRNLKNNRFFSTINILGLAAGMTVALLIGLWIHDELSFNKYHKQYDNIVQVMTNRKIDGGLATYSVVPLPLSAELRKHYSSDFTYTAATGSKEQIITYENKSFKKLGAFAEPELPLILSLRMVKGEQTALNDPSSVLVSESLAETLFGDDDPVNKTIKINTGSVLQVKGVYKDIPKNSNFTGIELFLPMKVAFPPGAPMDNWYSSSFNVYAQLAPNSNRGQIVSKIKNIQYEHTKDASQPSIILNPMSKWHLYEFDNGALTSGRLRFVWLFGIIAVFVLILACINFMNLSKARSEKRAREIGVRKAIGSGRSQLVKQFLTESLLIVLLAFCIAIGITYLSLSWFNELSGKDLAIDWSEPFFWIVSMAFIIITSLLAGSFPALFLSSFNPVKALKGTFTTGRYSSIPRKVLVVVQFTVSIVMIMGTLIVYNQVKFARDRPVGYDREKLITIQLTTDEIKDHYAAFRNDLLAAGAVKNVALSSSPATGIWSSADNLDWKGKDPSRQSAFGTILVEPEFGNTVGWKMKEGRNFSAAFSTDSFAFIFNEAAIRQMGLEQPIGETIKWHGKNWKLIGVVNDMVMTSPFDPARPVVFMMNDKERSFNVINVKLNPAIPVKSALSGIETVFKKYATTAPFDYKFVDTEYGLKFTSEERTGQLAAVFAGLAIFISCLGLFGLASFVAEKRTKEIGVRKILGASVFNLWGMLSKDFVLLIVISSCIAVPVSYYYMDKWLHNYQYRTTISWWVFAVTIGGALAIALLTVSFQALKAAVANPVKSLRTE